MIHFAYKYGADFRKSLTESVNVGGENVARGQTLGALLGAALGASRLPTEWKQGLKKSVELGRDIEAFVAMLTTAGERPSYGPKLVACAKGRSKLGQMLGPEPGTAKTVKKNVEDVSLKMKEDEQKEVVPKQENTSPEAAASTSPVSHVRGVSMIVSL